MSIRLSPLVFRRKQEGLLVREPAAERNGLDQRIEPLQPRARPQSTMNFVSLVTHGMSAISVHAETVGSRMLVLAVLFGGAILLAMGAVVAVRLLTDLAIPGWATYAFGLLFLMLMQTTFIALFFAGTVLHGRNAYTFLPSRDHVYFVDTLESVDVKPRS